MTWVLKTQKSAILNDVDKLTKGEFTWKFQISEVTVFIPYVTCGAGYYFCRFGYGSYIYQHAISQ